MRAERRQAMVATAGMVAHELRTPLLSVKSGASGLRHFLPVLLDAYRLAVDGKLLAGSIRGTHLDSMAGVLDRIEMEADRSNTVIDMLLYTVRGMGVEGKELVPCLMSTCVDTALRRYPFASDKERALVHWDMKADFSFMGSELLMVHVIFNLLKNALRHIAIAGKGTISIGPDAGPAAVRFAIEGALRADQRNFDHAGTGTVFLRVPAPRGTFLRPSRHRPEHGADPSRGLQRQALRALFGGGGGLRHAGNKRAGFLPPPRAFADAQGAAHRQGGRKDGGAGLQRGHHRPLRPEAGSGRDEAAAADHSRDAGDLFRGHRAHHGRRAQHRAVALPARSLFR